MFDYEYMILERQERETDDCAACVWLADCRQGARPQCETIEEHFNPILQSMIEYMENKRNA